MYFKHNESKCVLVIPGRQLLYSNDYVRGSKYFLRRLKKNMYAIVLDVGDFVHKSHALKYSKCVVREIIHSMKVNAVQ